MYLDTGAVRFMADKPFIFTSGWASPVYNDSRWLISFPDVRIDDDGFRGRHHRPRHRPRQDRRGGGRRDRRHSLRRLGGRPAQSADAICAQEAEGLRPRRADRRPADPRPARAAGRGPRHRRPQQGEFRQGDPRRRRQVRALLRDFLLRHLSRKARKSSADLGVTLHALTTWRDVLAVAKASGQVRAEDAGRGGEVHRTIRPAGRRRMAAWRRRRSDSVSPTHRVIPRAGIRCRSSSHSSRG